MADAVKRTYDSPRRREQAEQTRLQILEAAQRLFERDGYATTTVAAIAAEAGVATKTVYLAFESKSGILRALWHLLLRGDQADVPVGEGDWYRDTLAEPDPDARVVRLAERSRDVKLRAGEIMEVIRTAAPADRDIGELWARIQSNFRDLLRPVVESLRDDGVLRDGLDVDEATDVLWVLVHTDIWQLLVNERGWSPDRYQQWCLDTIRAQLLEPSPYFPAGGGLRDFE
jgi:AcrR family transcriptional regulator